jgi:RNA polymerase sigma factor (sigma-70 family)
VVKLAPEQLRRPYEEGRRRYGPLPLPFEAFAAQAVERVERGLGRCGRPVTAERVVETLARSSGPDLFLAVACEEGVPGAWEAFARAFTDPMKAVARRHGAAPAEAEELAHDLAAELPTRPPGRAGGTQLRGYEGTGSLAAWLGVIVLRRRADRARARKPVPLPLQPLPDRVQDPAAAAAELELSARLEQALADAWPKLTPPEALALVAHFRDGRTQEEIGLLLGVRQPRVSKVLSAALGRLRGALESALEEATSEVGPTMKLALARYLGMVPGWLTTLLLERAQ